MVTEEELNQLGQIIDECQDLASTVEVIVEVSLKYIFSELYCKMLLTMSEIYTLLVNGYPEGAMTLARNTYETMVVMTYLYDRKGDLDLLERYCDDYCVKTCKDHIKFLNWVHSNGGDNEDTQRILQERKDQFNEFLEKYSAFVSSKKGTNFFEQYWWAGKGKSFNQLRIEANYPDNYLYDIACYRAHAGMTGMLRFDNTEEGLLMGSCEYGKELPTLFAILNFTVSTKLYFDLQGKDCSVVHGNLTSLLEKVKLKVRNL